MTSLAFLLSLTISKAECLLGCATYMHTNNKIFVRINVWLISNLIDEKQVLILFEAQNGLCTCFEQDK